MAGTTRPPLLDMEISVHISAPTSRRDDEHFRALALAYEDFDVSGRIVSANAGSGDDVLLVEEESPDNSQPRGVAASTSSRKQGPGSSPQTNTRTPATLLGRHRLYGGSGPKISQAFAEAPDFGSLRSTAWTPLVRLNSSDGLWRKRSQEAERDQTSHSLGQDDNVETHDMDSQSDSFIDDTQLAVSRLESQIDVSEFGGWPSSSPLRERSSKRYRSLDDVGVYSAGDGAHHSSFDKHDEHEAVSQAASSSHGLDLDADPTIDILEQADVQEKSNQNAIASGNPLAIGKAPKSPSFSNKSGHQPATGPEDLNISSTNILLSGPLVGTTATHDGSIISHTQLDHPPVPDHDPYILPDGRKTPQPSLDSHMLSYYGEENYDSQRTTSNDLCRSSRSTSQGSTIKRSSNESRVFVERAGEDRETEPGADAWKEVAPAAPLTDADQDFEEHLRLYSSEPPISTAECAQRQPPPPQPAPAAPPKTTLEAQSKEQTHYDFPLLPVEIHAPSPAVSTSKTFNETTSNLLAYTRGLPRPLFHFWRPVSTARPLRATDRGRWVFNTTSWPAAIQLEFWTRMEEMSARGNFGSTVWFQRNTHPEPRLQGYVTDGGEAEGLGEVWVFCWGQVVWDVAAMLYVESARRVKGSGARFVTGPVGDLEVLVRMV